MFYEMPLDSCLYSIKSPSCSEVFHYRASWYRDFVPRIDGAGAERERDNVFELRSHAKASLFDHEFMSPTYKEKISWHLETFIERMRHKI